MIVSSIQTTFLSCNTLDVSELRHHRINHSEMFVEARNDINGIENFWNQAKRHLRHFNGIPRKYCNLYQRV
jgi:transposase